jgi:hypothetical protein
MALHTFASCDPSVNDAIVVAPHLIKDLFDMEIPFG